MKLDAYLERIGFQGEGTVSGEALRPRPNLQTLQTLVLLHTRAIAFENLNSLLRLPVALELSALQAKLVRQRRGGYCFEQNGLFAAVLEDIGFDVRRLAARVVWGQGDVSSMRFPRTHMVLSVRAGASLYLCDVGFGGITPTAPLRLDTDAEQSTPHEPFRLLHADGLYTLQAKISGKWLDVYVFDLQLQSHVDYEMANHYVCTWPQSHFRFTLIAARATDGGRHHLRNRQLTTFAGDSEPQRRELHGTEQFVEVLDRIFGIEVPDVDAFSQALACNIEGDDLTR